MCSSTESFLVNLIFQKLTQVGKLLCIILKRPSAKSKAYISHCCKVVNLLAWLQLHPTQQVKFGYLTVFFRGRLRNVPKLKIYTCAEWLFLLCGVVRRCSCRPRYIPPYFGVRLHYNDWDPFFDFRPKQFMFSLKTHTIEGPHSSGLPKAAWVRLHFDMHFFALLGKTITWNDQIVSFLENVGVWR